MEIRTLSVNDARAMAAIERQIFSTPWSVNMCRAELANIYSCYWGAFEDYDLIAYAGLNIVAGEEGHITNVAVLPGHRRSGIAKRLIYEMLGLDMRMYTLEVRESNAAAIALYNSFGFEILGKRKNYYYSPAEDALIMTKEMTL